jgi:uncharacterized protein with HEPN domain
MSRDYRPFLDDIRRACDKVVRFTAGQSFEEFVADEKTFDAVLRNLAIIGEAVVALSHVLPTTDNLSRVQSHEERSQGWSEVCGG